MAKSDKKATKKTQAHVIHPKDLPLSCPTPEVALWSAHPKVYLPIEETGREVCPYCGTTFVLKYD